MIIGRVHRIVLFLIITFALSTAFYIQIASIGKLKMLPTLGLMWCPGLAALIVRLLTQRNLNALGWNWGPLRWNLVGYLLPPVLGIVIYGLVWLTRIGGFAPDALQAAISKDAGMPIPVPAILVAVVIFGLVPAVIFALGEEIGWRGFLVPELAGEARFATTAWITGIIWSLYHYPLILFSKYNSGAPKWFALLAFTWMVIASSFAFTWLRLKSGSLWPCVLLHSSHNLFIQQLFDPLTEDRGITKYFTTEFGLGLAIGYTLLAVYFWSRRSELPVHERQMLSHESATAAVGDTTR